MRLIGLEFWLKNNNEMKELYEDGNYSIIPPDLLVDDFKKHINVIGGAACDNVLTVLDQFSSKLIDCLAGKVSIRRNSKNNKMKQQWTVQHVLWDKDKDDGKEWLTMIGANIDIEKIEFVVWCWKRGGSTSGDFTKNIFSKYFENIQKGKAYSYNSGNVIIYTLNLALLCSGYIDNDNFVEELDFFKMIRNVTKEDWNRLVG
jgi:hypothetical protein